jgi:hypothetical protein
LHKILVSVVLLKWKDYMNKKLKIYLDTSIINFLFADDAPDLKEINIDFFENYMFNYDIEISDIVITEINKTKNQEKRELLFNAINKYKLLIKNKLSEEIFEFAKYYIDYGIIPENKPEDAQHIAFATFYEFDILLSWNFKHLANINKQMLVNSLNLQKGYNKPLLLLNPMEVMYEK